MHLGTADQMEIARAMIEEQMGQPTFVDAASRCGYDTEALGHLREEILGWSDRPDAFWALMMCHAIGWAS